MATRNSRVILAVAVTLIVAGCTARHYRGVATPARPAPSTTASVSKSAEPRYPDLLPPRPRELDLAGVDPCADLLADQQLRELHYDLGYARPPAPGRDSIHGGPTCAFASNGGSGGVNRNVDTLVTISTTEGALAWVTDPARVPDARPEVVNVQGFSALVLPHPILPDDCLVVVDTAQGQYLDVTSGASDGTGSAVKPYCEEAERVAGMAIQTISASGNVNPLPPRPRELNLAGVDPCTDLLTNQQLRELDYDLGFARPPKPGHSDIHGGVDCTFASNGGDGGPSRDVRTLVGISTTEGALAWVTDPARAPDTRPAVVQVGGFSALVLPNPRVPDNCKVVVDTAQGQYLEVSSGQAAGEGMGSGTLCAEAERVAGMAIQTVSAR